MPITPTSSSTENWERGAVDQHRKPSVTDDSALALEALHPGRRLNPQPSPARFSSHVSDIMISPPYAAAAATATSPSEREACLFAASKLQSIEFPLLKVMAERDDSQKLWAEHGLGAIEPRTARILAGVEVDRRDSERQDKRWRIEKWLWAGMAVIGWLIAVFK